MKIALSIVAAIAAFVLTNAAVTTLYKTEPPKRAPEPSASVVPTSATLPPGPNGGVIWTSADQTFAVEFPTTPIADPVPNPLPAGFVRGASETARHGDTTFTILYLDLTPRQGGYNDTKLSAELNLSMTTGAVGGIQGIPVTTRDGFFASLPTVVIDFTIPNTNQTGRIEGFVAGNRYYAFVGYGPTIPSDQLAKLEASFHFVNAD